MSLRGLRLNLGLTVVEVAEATDIKPTSIYYYERTGAMPREPEKAKAIADLFEVKVTDIWPIALDGHGPERRAVA